jgi:hypothetical protein
MGPACSSLAVAGCYGPSKAHQLGWRASARWNVAGVLCCCPRVGHGPPVGRRTPTGSLGQSSRRVKDRARRPPMSGVLAMALRPAGGGGVLRRPPMASLPSPSRRKQQSPAPSRSALRARDALVLKHLPLADAIASATARRLFPLVEREGSDPGGPRGPGPLRSPLQGRRARWAQSAPLHQRGPAAPPARSGAAGPGEGSGSPAQQLA